MARSQPQPRFTADEYLDREQAQSERHEYIDGEVFAMAGGEDLNSTVALNLAVALRQHLRGAAGGRARRHRSPRHRRLPQRRRRLWVLHPFSGDQAVELASVALTVPAAELFADLEGETPTKEIL